MYICIYTTVCTTQAHRITNASRPTNPTSNPNPIPNHEQAPLKAYVHNTARRAVEAGQSTEQMGQSIAEQRVVVTAFSLVKGLEAALLSGASGVHTVQACIAAAMRSVEELGGVLRQFILDDKGVVIIWTFGLPGSTYEDNAARGLGSCFRVNAALKAQGLAPCTGVTVGSAFCGLVGARYRCEYSVLGPSVNLAARLMTSCASKAVELLCNDALHDEVTRRGH